MNLAHPNLTSSLDSSNLLAQIQNLPTQLESAYLQGFELPLPDEGSIRSVLITGMGGSAAAGDLMSAFCAPLCQVPLVLHRDYGLPAWATGAETLVIACSHSGDTEETLSAFQAAQERGCRVLAISTGGALMRAASELGLPHWRYTHSGQPRTGVGITFGLMASLLVRLGLLPDLRAELAATANLLREIQVNFQPDVPVAKNRARRDAGQLVGRWVTVFGADHLAPVARRWKNQINELAKAWAQAEILPEADHNTLAGLLNPEDALLHTLALFLTAPGNHPRNQLRVDLTRQFFMEQGIGTDLFVARGETRLAQMWSALHYGDYLAYYLALAYNVDPSPVDMLTAFKQALSES